MVDEQPSSIATFIEPRPESVKRRNAKARVELRVGSSPRHSFYQGFADIVSARGVFVGTHVVRPIGEHLDISLLLPDSEEPICATCEVRWARIYAEESDAGPGMGLEFIELPERAAERIENFLRSEQALFFDDEWRWSLRRTPAHSGSEPVFTPSNSTVER